MGEEMSMASIEISRLIDFLRRIGLSEKVINDCIQYIATGVGGSK